jgi:hypothetical protein
MTKLVDADWLRGVQLFFQLPCSTIIDFFKNKQNGGKAEFKEKRNCSRGNKITPENTNKAPNPAWLKVWREWNMMFTLRFIAFMIELDKALQNFTLMLVDVNLSC